MLRELPPDATLDNAIERLLFLAEIERGLVERDADRGDRAIALAVNEDSS